MEMTGKLSHTFRLCATVLFAVSRSAGSAAFREGDHAAVHGDRLEVCLGWPFTSIIWLSSEEAVRIVAALKTTLRSLAVVALGTTLDVSALAFCSSSSSSSSSNTINTSSSSNSSRSAICLREASDTETSAMREVVKAYTTGGGVWPGTGPRTVQPSIVGGDKAPMMQRVLLHLKDSGESGRVVLRGLLGDPGGWPAWEFESTSSSVRTETVLLCAQSSATEEAPPSPPEASTSIGNTMIEMPTPAASTSRVDLLCMHGRGSTVSFAEVTTSRLLTNNEPANKECGIEQRLQGAATSSQNGACERPHDRTRSNFGIASAKSPWHPFGLRLFNLPWSQKLGQEQEQERQHVNDVAGGSRPALDDDPVITAASAAAVAKSQPVAPVTPCSSSAAVVSVHDEARTSNPTGGRSRLELGSSSQTLQINTPGASCGGPQAASSSCAAATSPKSGVPDALVNPSPPPVRSSLPPRQRPAREVGNDKQEKPLTVATAAAISRDQSGAAAAQAAALVTSSPTIADDSGVKKLERPSPFTEGAVVNPSDVPFSSSASPPRGRRRAPSSPRGRPSSGSPGGRPSPFRPAASSSSPSSSSCASVSPSRRRGSVSGSSSPRAGGRSDVAKDRSTVARSLFRSPPPPDLSRSCYYGIGGLSDNGAFWDGGSKPRHSTSRSNLLPHAAVNILLSRSKEALAKAETDKPPGVSSSSSSPSPSAALEQATAAAAAAAADAAAAATAAEARKKARRVTWSPVVLAREDAVAFIRTRVKHYAEAEEMECRLAHCENATQKFVDRRAEERAERERGGAPACPPAPRWGPFFAFLAGFETWPGRGIRLWPDDYVTPPPPPPGRVTSLGDVVRGMCGKTC